MREIICRKIQFHLRHPTPPPSICAGWCSGKTNSAVSDPSFAREPNDSVRRPLMKQTVRIQSLEWKRRGLEFNLFIKILHVCFAVCRWRWRRKQKSTFFIFFILGTAASRSITYHRVGKIQENWESCFYDCHFKLGIGWLAKTINKNTRCHTLNWTLEIIWILGHPPQLSRYTEEQIAKLTQFSQLKVETEFDLRHSWQKWKRKRGKFYLQWIFLP